MSYVHDKISIDVVWKEVAITPVRDHCQIYMNFCIPSGVYFLVSREWFEVYNFSAAFVDCQRKQLSCFGFNAAKKNLLAIEKLGKPPESCFYFFFLIVSCWDFTRSSFSQLQDPNYKLKFFTNLLFFKFKCFIVTIN